MTELHTEMVCQPEDPRQATLVGGGGAPRFSDQQRRRRAERRRSVFGGGEVNLSAAQRGPLLTVKQSTKLVQFLVHISQAYLELE